MDGFTYNGIHSSTFNCYYIPDESALFDTKADFEVYDSEPAWQHGGQYFGTRLKSRTFSLSCFFEDISQETKEKMMLWQDRKTSGLQVFDERPFVYYKVHPTKKLTGKIYQHQTPGYGITQYSGTFTITFTAYDPFGYQTEKCYEDYDMSGIHQYCGILEKNEMPKEPLPTDRSIMVYNCGTERCGAVIRIGGTAPNGQTITNMTNNNVCKLLTLPPESTYQELDSDAGTVKKIEGMNVTDAYEYHDEGYITLEPCGFNYDDITVSYEKDSNKIMSLDRTLDSSYVGKYLWLSGAWYRIISVLADGIVLNGRLKESGMEKVHFVTMNLQNITGADINLNKLEIDYRPKVL